MSIWRFLLTKYRALYAFIYIFIHSLIFAYFLTEPGIDANSRALVSGLVYGTAYKPFVFRSLLPTTVRIITLLIPSGIRDFFNQSLGENPIVQNVFLKLGWEQGYLTEYCITLILLYLSLWGFCFSIRYLFTGLFRAPDKLADLVPLIALLGLPPFFSYTNYIYDIPNWFLSTLVLGLMVYRRWQLFILIFPIACFNKETAILLILTFTIHFIKQNNLRRTLFIKLLIFQVVSFILIKTTISSIFQHNPGSLIEFHLFDSHNLLWVRDSLLNFSPVVKYRQLITAITFFALVRMVFYKWSDKPTFLKDGVWVVVPLFLLNTLFGWWDEWRAYYEAYPIVILLVIHSGADILGIKITKLEKNGRDNPELRQAELRQI